MEDTTSRVRLVSLPFAAAPVTIVFFSFRRRYPGGGFFVGGGTPVTDPVPLTRQAGCDLCECEELTVYLVEMPHLVAYRCWLCRPCLLAVRDATDTHEIEDDEVGAFLDECYRQRA